MIARWIQDVAGHPVSGMRRLPGATSSSLYVVTLDSAPALVLRLFTNDQWLATEPDLAAHEAAVLEHLELVDLPTPELIAFDADGSLTGVPAILMTLLPGEVELLPDDMDLWLAALAEPLNILHAHPAPAFAWSYDPWVDQTRLHPPQWAKDPLVWESAFTRYAAGMPDAPLRLLHRDYHPTNVLWADGTISGVVDWVNACIGPQSADVAHCRLNLALMYGQEAAARFLDHLDDAYDPIWDLAPALSAFSDLGVYPPWREFGLLGITTQMVRDRMEEFLRRAIEK